MNLICTQHNLKGTRFFGLGNLNKMKQLNDGGNLVVKFIQKASYLKDKGIHVWTGDSLTSASVYNQIAWIPSLTGIFFIGAHGKKHNAICYHFIRESVAAGIIRIAYITSTKNLADMFTKLLGAIKLKTFAQQILYWKINTSSCNLLLGY